jgi:hypothetical protein
MTTKKQKELSGKKIDWFSVADFIGSAENFPEPLGCENGETYSDEFKRGWNHALHALREIAFFIQCANSKNVTSDERMAPVIQSWVEMFKKLDESRKI